MKSEEQISLNEEGQLACDVKSRNRTRPGHFWNARDLNSAPNCAPQSMNFLGWEFKYFLYFLSIPCFTCNFKWGTGWEKKNYFAVSALISIANWNFKTLQRGRHCIPEISTMQMRFYLARRTYFEFAFLMMTEKIALRRISKLSQACRRKILTFLSAVTKDVCFSVVFVNDYWVGK